MSYFYSILVDLYVILFIYFFTQTFNTQFNSIYIYVVIGHIQKVHSFLVQNTTWSLCTREGHHYQTRRKWLQSTLILLICFKRSLITWSSSYNTLDISQHLHVKLSLFSLSCKTAGSVEWLLLCMFNQDAFFVYGAAQ